MLVCVLVLELGVTACGLRFALYQCEKRMPRMFWGGVKAGSPLRVSRTTGLGETQWAQYIRTWPEGVRGLFEFRFPLPEYINKYIN